MKDIKGELGVLAPCDRWRECKLAQNSEHGNIIVENMGHAHWAGTIFCFRCEHHKPIDLFESAD